MSDRITSYTRAIVDTGTSGWLIHKVELIAADGALLATDQADEAAGSAGLWQVEAEPAEFAAGDISQRSGSAVVSSNEVDLVPSGRTGVLHPNEQPRVRFTAGVRTGAGDVWFEPQATLAVDEASAVSSSGLVTVRVDLIDSIDPVRSDLVTAFQWEDGEPVEEVAARLLGQVLDEEAFSLQPTGFTTRAGSVEAGIGRWDLVDRLLESCGQELVTDPWGLVVSRSIPRSDDDNTVRRWSYGGDGIPMRSISRVWSLASPAAWRAVGGAPLTDEPGEVVTVFDLDRDSLGFFSGLGTPVKVSSSSYPWTDSLRQLSVAAYASMRRAGTGPGVVEFTAAPNPALRQGDLIDLTDDGLRVDGSYRVLGYKLPQRNEQMMTVTARAVWDPAVGYKGPGLDLDPNCHASFLDLFDRPDENLERLPGGDDGSAQWTEIRPSWGVVGNRAVQRFDGGWSLALVNKPLCTSNHFVEALIGGVPSGRRVGPVARGSGEFDGYAALVSERDVTLELWLGGKSCQTLGVWHFDGSMAGSTIRIEAEGDAIEVQVNGETKIDVTDGQLTGSFAAMLGYGGAGDQAPSVESFAVGAL